MGSDYKLAILISHPVQYFSPLFRKLAQHPKIDLTVLYCSLDGARETKDPDFGISFVWDTPLLEGYQYKELKNWRSGPLNGFFSSINPGVLGEIRCGGYDAIIVFGWASLTNWLAFGAASVAGVPWMLYGDTISLYEGEQPRLKRALRRPLLKSLFSRTDAFLISGAFNRAFYQFYGVSLQRCFEFPLCVDSEFFKKGAEAARQRRAEILAKYGIATDSVVFVFVGKLSARKRPQDLISALQIIRSSVPNGVVLFAGEGELRSSLEAQIKREGLENAALLLGFKNQTELPEVYAVADAFVLPSSSDPKPLVTNEAMACGLPVLASDRTGVWGPGDILRHGENGFVYRCGDIAELAEAMRKIAVDPNLRQRMGAKSRDIVRDFGYDRCVQGIVEAMSTIARRDTPSGQVTREESSARSQRECEY